MDDFVVSDSGVKVWTTPEAHPLLRHTDTTHPSLLEKLYETYPTGRARGLPKILSENSEDARTWFYFSSLLRDCAARNRVLGRLVRQSFPGVASPSNPGGNSVRPAGVLAKAPPTSEPTTKGRGL